MNWSDFETYLKPAHLQGKAVTVTIARIEVHETHPKPGKPVKAPVLFFKGHSKGLVLSNFNMRVLADMFGDDSDRCIGQRVTLQAVQVQVGKATKTPIRIGHALAAVAPAEPQPMGHSQQGGCQPIDTSSEQTAA